MLKIYLVMLFTFTSLSVLSESEPKRPTKRVGNNKTVVVKKNGFKNEPTKILIPKAIPYDGNALAPIKIKKKNSN